MAETLMIGSWNSRFVAMVAAGLRLTGTKAKQLAITTSNDQKLVLTDGTILTQTRSMVLKLVELAGSPFTKTLLGADALERAQVTQWMEYTATKCNNKDATEDSVQNLDAHFKSSTFLALERMTLADLMLYHALYPYIAEAPPMKMKSHIPSVCRWFDLVQNNEFFSKGANQILFHP
jgi:glutathione S-transferase